MTQHPLVPLITLYHNDPRDTYRPETEREIFMRISRTMQEDRRRDRRNRAFARLRRSFRGGSSVAPGSRRVANTH